MDSCFSSVIHCSVSISSLIFYDLSFNIRTVEICPTHQIEKWKSSDFLNTKYTCSVFFFFLLFSCPFFYLKNSINSPKCFFCLQIQSWSLMLYKEKTTYKMESQFWKGPTCRCLSCCLPMALSFAMLTTKKW